MVDLLPGVQIKHYTLQNLLGRGASGEVWRATDGTRTVAIKFMNAALLNSQAAAKHRQRMEREIKALSALQHPHITALYDYDLAFQPPYLVMEYVDSLSYEHLISTGEMLHVPALTRLDMLAKLASALSQAHDLGIIHRDIKPGNMNGVEHPYLLDFSIALEQENVEHTNFNVGTTIYMTPDDEPPDRMSDNFSFALVAYEVLFGVHPIFAPDDRTRTMGAYARVQMYQRLKSRDWRLPTRIPAEELPLDLRGADLAQLDNIFQKALSARDTRYADLNAFVADLRAAITVPANQPYLRQAQAVVAVPAISVPDPEYARQEAARAAKVRDTREEVAQTRPKRDMQAYSTVEAAGITPSQTQPKKPAAPHDDASEGGLKGWLKGLFGRK